MGLAQPDTPFLLPGGSHDRIGIIQTGDDGLNGFSEAKSLAQKNRWPEVRMLTDFAAEYPQNDLRQTAMVLRQQADTKMTVGATCKALSTERATGRQRQPAGKSIRRGSRISKVLIKSARSVPTSLLWLLLALTLLALC